MANFTILVSYCLLVLTADLPSRGLSLSNGRTRTHFDVD